MLLNKIKSFFSSEKSLPNIPIGERSRVTGTIVLGHPSSTIEIGHDSLMEGTLTTYLEKSKLKIGNNVFIGTNSFIGCAEEITIGDHVLISFDCIIQDTDTHHLDAKKRKNDTVDWMNGKKNWDQIPSAKITIDKDAWIGARSIILKGVHIGEGAVVGAGSCVTKDVEPYTVVAGNPARFIKNIER